MVAGIHFTIHCADERPKKSKCMTSIYLQRFQIKSSQITPTTTNQQPSSVLRMAMTDSIEMPRMPSTGTLVFTYQSWTTIG
jgi:hypothetical protein